MNGAKKRIGVFLPKYSPYGGQERFAMNLSEALAGQGHDVTFVCARQEAEPTAGVRVRRVGRFGLTRAGKALWFAWRATRVQREAGFDLTIGIGRSFGHDLQRINAAPQRIFWSQSERAWPSGWRRLLKRWRRRLDPLAPLSLAIEKWQLRSARMLVMVSHKTRDWVLSEYPGLAGKDIRVVYNRPDLTRFRPPDPEEREQARQRFGVQSEQVVVGGGGTSFMRKGVRPLVRAMALLPEDHLLLVAGGRNPEDYLRLASKAGVEERVRFVGRVDDMETFYAACDVFVLPSFHDTCSNAVVEALACGVRVVASDTDGSSWFVPAGSVVSEPGDPAALAAVVRETLARRDWTPEHEFSEVACGMEPYLKLVAELLEEDSSAAGRAATTKERT